MSARGPTQTTDGTASTTRWASRPGVARAAKLLVAATPVLLSIAFSWAVSQLLPPSRLGVSKWVWWIGLICVTTLVLARIDKFVRRAAPLSALLQLSLVFPDEAPSRYKSAMRSFSARKVQRRLDDMRNAGFELSADENRSQQMLDLLAMLSDHDRMTRGHSERVRAYAEMIGREMNLTEDDLDKLNWAALLHDLGKLTVPPQILNKDGRPDDNEWRILSGHPAAGIPLAAPIADWLGEWTSAIGQHHERWDGKGYPDGFSGTQIPLGARIVAVADAYDVMTSTRSYKKPYPAEVARQEIADGAGTQFCPHAARAFLAVPASRLKAVAGPLSWVGGLPGLRNVPVAEVVGSSTVTAASATLTAVATVAAVPSLAPLPASAESAPPAPAVVVESTTTTTPTTTTTLPEEPAELVIEIPTAGATVSATTTAVTTTAVPTTTIVAPTTTVASSTTTATTAPPSTTAPSTTAPTTTVSPTNSPPVAQSDLATVAEGAAIVIDVLGNDSDPDAADVISLDSPGAPANGTSVDNGDGTITYTHDGSETVSDSLTYTINDGNGGTDSAIVTITVTPVNEAPTAVADGATAIEGGAVVIPVLANDTDPDLATVLSVDSFTPPSRGSVVDNGDGTLTYTHDGGLSTSDTFTYTAIDQGGLGDAATVSITITPTNDPPTANDDSFASPVAVPLVIAPVQLVANDIDEEDGIGFGAATVRLVAPFPTGATVIQPGGTGTSITYTADPGELGPQTFGYEVCDSGAQCTSGLATVSVDTGFGILISEFSTDDAYSVGNFVELYNASAGPIDVSGWELRLAFGSNSPAQEGTWTTTVTLSGPNTLIPAGGHYLVGDHVGVIAGLADQVTTHNFREDLGIGLHNGTTYVDVVGNREQTEQGPVFEATLVDGTGVSPLKSLPNYELSYVRRPGLDLGHCTDSDDNQYDWERVTTPTPENSSAPIVLCAVAPAGPQALGLVISEFRTDGPFSGSNEFVELFNPTAAPIDLTGLQLRDEGGAVIETLDAFMLQPGQHYLVGHGSYTGPRDETYATGGWANSSAIEIWDPGGLTQIDYVDFGDSLPALPHLGQRLQDTYERRDGGCRDTDVWIDDFVFQMAWNPQTSADPLTPCA